MSPYPDRNPRLNPWRPDAFPEGASELASLHSDNDGVTVTLSFSTNAGDQRRKLFFSKPVWFAVCDEGQRTRFWMATNKTWDTSNTLSNVYLVADSPLIDWFIEEGGTFSRDDLDHFLIVTDVDCVDALMRRCLSLRDHDAGEAIINEPTIQA